MSATGHVLVQMDGARFRYRPDQPPVLDDVSWRIDDASFVVVTGMSGTGKSTLLRSLNGLAPHFTGGEFGGDILVGGENTRTYPTRAFSRLAGFVFQDPDAQAVSGRVDDEMAFGMEQLGLPGSTMRRRVEEMLDLLGIAHLRARAVSTLSGGERQRVSIAAALAMGPKLLLLDEPTSQLDPAGAEDVILTLHRLNEEFGVTVVMSEHRLERVVRYADQLRVLESGGSWQGGDPQSVLARIDERLAPPLVRVAARLGWNPVPLTVKAGRLAWRQDGRLLAPSPSDSPRPDAPPAIRVIDAELAYGATTILRSVEFDVRPGEILVMMGRNGSGKTTLLRAMIGLHPLAHGSIRLLSQAPGDLDSAGLAKLVGFLPQRARALLFNETVRDEVLFAVDHRNRDRGQLDGLLAEFDLGHLIDRHPFDLSVGEQERLALAVTLAGDPDILLLDEPTRGLDAIRKDHLASSLKRRAGMGAAVVLATHDVELAAAVATRVLILGNEGIITGGPPRETLSGSLAYSTQINKVFGSGYLTVQDLVAALT